MSEEIVPSTVHADQLEIGLNRGVFLRSLIRELSGSLEEIVGIREASGFISLVGQNIGDQLNAEYKAAFQVPKLDRLQVSEVLVDLKKRIQGDFYLIEQTPGKLVFGNRACPFAEKVIGRTSMCMMTSNVFGAITAQNLGYSKVELQQTIAKGDAGCLVVVHTGHTAEAEAAEGREYFQTES